MVKVTDTATKSLAAFSTLLPVVGTVKGVGLTLSVAGKGIGFRMNDIKHKR